MSRSEEWPRELRAATDIAGSRLYCACEAGTGRFSTGEAAGTFGTFDSGEDPGLGEVLPEAENTEIFV